MYSSSTARSCSAKTTALHALNGAIREKPETYSRKHTGRRPMAREVEQDYLPKHRASFGRENGVVTTARPAERLGLFGGHQRDAEIAR